MKIAAALLLFLLAAPAAHAAQAVQVQRAPSAPAVDTSTERLTCQMVQPMYASTPQRVCLTQGQRAASAASSAAAAQAKAGMPVRSGPAPACPPAGCGESR